MILTELWVGVLLTVVGVTMMICAFMTGMFSIFFFLGHARMLLPFRNGYQEGEGEVVRFTERNDNDSSIEEPSRNPVIRYYNAYQQKIVEEEVWNSGIHSPRNKQLFPREKQAIVEAGTIVAVQYTKKAVRIVDRRFISEKRYDIKRYVRPIVLCLIFGVIGVMLLIIGISM